MPATGAAVVLVKVPAGDIESVSFDRDAVAFWTVRVLPWMTGNIADIDVLQSLLPGNPAVVLQGLHRRRGQVHHLVIGVEA